jgi:hypothetical protein
MSTNKRWRIIINILILAFLISGTAIAIKISKGYRPDIRTGTLSGNGLLAVTSYPKSARVIINDKLTTVTDDKLYLTPGTYDITIERDGFHPYTKTTTIQNELVTTLDARLFPIITGTSPVTFYSVSNTSVSPDGTKVAYHLQGSPIAGDDGLYIYNFNSNFLTAQTIKIADEFVDWSTADLIWSPDSNQMLTVVYSDTQSKGIESAYILNTKSLNNARTLTDVSFRLRQITTDWHTQYQKINSQILSLYPNNIQELLKSSYNVYFSPDREKVIYTASSDLVLDTNKIASKLPSINNTPEDRELAQDSTYVFDLKEGTNYALKEASISSTLSQRLITLESTPSADIRSHLLNLKAQSDSSLTTNHHWYPNNRQIILATESGLHIVDYDGVSPTLITRASIRQGLSIASPDGTRLLLLTNINQIDDTYNLITFDLR